MSDLSLPSLSTSPIPDYAPYASSPNTTSVTFSSPTSTFYCSSNPNSNSTHSEPSLSVSTPSPVSKAPDHASYPLSSNLTLAVPPLIVTPTSPNKPARPPPPKSAEYLKRQTSSTPANTIEMGDVTSNILG